jgi:hypothetical protein
MKTQMLFIAALLFAGLMFTSCQKEAGLVPDEPSVQAIENDNALLQVDPKPGDEDEVMIDPISNYPDPFPQFTTIAFRVWKATKVSLIIYNDQDERVAVLVGQFLNEGDYRTKFDARRLPAGKYYAVLQVGNSRITEEMTKVISIHAVSPGLE